MFIFVAVGTQVFPVAAVWRVIVVVAVLMMDCKKVLVGLIKLATAFGTDQPMYPQGF
jgi:hypothetical protein